MKNPIKNATFIARSIGIHAGKYTYLNCDFEKSTVKVTITCPDHGDFQILPPEHLKGRGCRHCGIASSKKAKTLDTPAFIERAIRKHGDLYDYTKTEYVGSLSPVTITCPLHGDFTLLASNHIQGGGCQICSKESDVSKYQRLFIERAKILHGDLYDYSGVVYANAKEKVRLSCPKHGDFMITPDNHLAGNGCYHCGIEKNTENMTSTREEFIEKAIAKHGEQYDYSKVVYTTALEPVTITCPLHGDYTQPAARHLSGHPCPDCVEDNYATIKRYVYVLRLNNDEGKYVYKIGKSVTPDVRARSLANALNMDNYTPDVRRIWLYETNSRYTQSLVERLLQAAINFPTLQKHELPDGYVESRITSVPEAELIAHCDKVIATVNSLKLNKD